MRKKDDAKKELILNYIHEYYGRFGKTPVVLEIASGTAISSATVHRYLVAMNESGELNYTGKGSIHTPKIEKERSRVYMPILGSVSCGPDQETYAPIYMDELQVQGVAVRVMHNLEQE